jgi:cytidyltransferase-like protein
MIDDNIIDLNQLKLIKKYPWQGKKTVLVGGCFDLFHYAHFLFLKGAKHEGEYLIVLLESDEFICNKKKREPVHTQKQRAEILASIIFVDMVILLPPNLSNEDYTNIVKLFKPAIVAVSENDEKMTIKKNQVKSVGGELKIVVPHFKNFSSSEILNSF